VICLDTHIQVEETIRNYIGTTFIIKQCQMLIIKWSMLRFEYRLLWVNI